MSVCSAPVNTSESPTLPRLTTAWKEHSEGLGASFLVWGWQLSGGNRWHSRSCSPCQDVCKLDADLYASLTRTGNLFSINGQNTNSAILHTFTQKQLPPYSVRLIPRNGCIGLQPKAYWVLRWYLHWGCRMGGTRDGTLHTNMPYIIEHIGSKLKWEPLSWQCYIAQEPFLILWTPTCNTKGFSTYTVYLRPEGAKGAKSQTTAVLVTCIDIVLHPWNFMGEGGLSIAIMKPALLLHPPSSFKSYIAPKSRNPLPLFPLLPTLYLCPLPFYLILTLPLLATESYKKQN